MLRSLKGLYLRSAGTSFWRGSKSSQPDVGTRRSLGKPQIPKSKDPPGLPQWKVLQNAELFTKAKSRNRKNLQLRIHFSCCCPWPEQTLFCWIVLTFQSVQSYPVMSLWAEDVFRPPKHVFCAGVC